MSRRRTELAARRERLQERSRALRGDVARHAQVLTPALAAVDRGRDALTWLHAHPALVAVAAAALALWRPRTLWRWGRRAWSAWRLVQRVRERLSAFRPAQTNPRGR